MSLPVQSLNITADNAVIGGKCLYFGYRAIETGGAAAAASIYDGIDNGGRLIDAVSLASGASFGDGPFNRGVICESGIYVDYTTGAMKVIVYYMPEIVMDASVLIKFAGSQRYIEKYLTMPDIYQLTQDEAN